MISAPILTGRRAVDLDLCPGSVIGLAAAFPQNPPISNLGHRLMHTAAKLGGTSKSVWGTRGLGKHCVNALKCLIFHCARGLGRQRDRFLALENVG